MWSLAGSHAVDQAICRFGPRWRVVSRSATLGLSRMLPADPAALGLCVGQLASAPGAHPSQAQGLLQNSWERARLGCVSSQFHVWTRGA